MYTAAPMPPAPKNQRQAGSLVYLWSAGAIVTGLVGVALALFSFGPVGMVIAGIGVAAGIVALLRTRVVDAHPLPAVGGLVVAALAVIVSAVMIVAPVLVTDNNASASPGESSGPVDPKEYLGNEDVEDVLAHELQVDFGEVTLGSDGPTVTVTLTNKLDRPKNYGVSVGAFDGSGVQIASVLDAGAILGAHAVQKRTLPLKGSVDQLKTATFKVTAVKSRKFSL